MRGWTKGRGPARPVPSPAGAVAPIASPSTLALPRGPFGPVADLIDAGLSPHVDWWTRPDREAGTGAWLRRGEREAAIAQFGEEMAIVHGVNPDADDGVTLEYSVNCPHLGAVVDARLGGGPWWDGELSSRPRFFERCAFEAIFNRPMLSLDPSMGLAGAMAVAEPGVRMVVVLYHGASDYSRTVLYPGTDYFHVLNIANRHRDGRPRIYDGQLGVVTDSVDQYLAHPVHHIGRRTPAEVQVMVTSDLALLRPEAYLRRAYTSLLGPGGPLHGHVVRPGSAAPAYRGGSASPALGCQGTRSRRWIRPRLPIPVRRDLRIDRTHQP